MKTCVLVDKSSVTQSLLSVGWSGCGRMRDMCNFKSDKLIREEDGSEVINSPGSLRLVPHTNSAAC